MMNGFGKIALCVATTAAPDFSLAIFRTQLHDSERHP